MALVSGTWRPESINAPGSLSRLMRSVKHPALGQHCQHRADPETSKGEALFTTSGGTSPYRIPTPIRCSQSVVKPEAILLPGPRKIGKPVLFAEGDSGVSEHSSSQAYAWAGWLTPNGLMGLTCYTANRSIRPGH